MTRKELEFSAKMSAAIDSRSVEDIKRKFQDIRIGGDLGKDVDVAIRKLKEFSGQRIRAENPFAEALGLKTQGDRPGFDKFKSNMDRAKQELSKYSAAEAKNQEGIKKALDATNKELEKAKKEHEAIRGLLLDETTFLEKINKLEKERVALSDQLQISQKMRQQAQEASDMIRPKTKGQKVVDFLETMSKEGLGGMLRALGPAGLVGGAAATTLMKAGDVYAGYGRIPLDVASAQGDAMRNTMGRELSEIYAGRGGLQSVFSPEKMRAAGMAREASEARRIRDATHHPLATGAVGAATGGAVGFIGGGVGAIPGAAIGGAVGLTAGLGKAMFDERAGAYFGKGLPGEVGRRYAQKYESMEAAEFARDFAKATEDLKAQNPLKTMAAEEFERNRERNLQFQRQMGFGFDEFHGRGGFREGAINAGFLDSQAMESASRIMAAGGSTRGARGLGVTGLGAQRAFDITNAPELLGKLSGAMGTSEATRQAFVKMIAEGQRLGLDSSEFREENRRFLDATADIVGRAQTTSQPDIDRLLQQFGGFLSDKTPTGIEAAKSAYEMYKQGTSATEGPRGVMRAAAFMRDPVIGGMGGMDMAALASIDMEHLNADHPVIKDLAQRYNVKGGPQALVDAARKAGERSFHRLGRADDLQSRIIEYRKQLRETRSDSARERLSAQISQAENEYGTMLTIENPALANSPKALRSMVEGTTAVDEAGRQKAFDTTQILKDLEDKKKAGRPEDLATQADAESSRLLLENFRNFKDQITPTAESVKYLNEQLKRTVEIAQKMSPEERTNVYQSLFPNIFGKPTNQPQAKGP